MSGIQGCNSAKNRHLVKDSAQAIRAFVIHLGVFGVIYTLKIVEGFFSGHPFLALKSMFGWTIGLGVHGIVVYFQHLASTKDLKMTPENSSEDVDEAAD